MKRIGGLHVPVLMAALALPMPARAENLVFITTNSAGDALYLDRESLQTVPPSPGNRHFAAVRIWAVNQVRGTRGSPTRTERFLFSFNCAQRTSTVLVYRNNRAGTRRQDWQAADLDFKYATPAPGTLADLSMSFACSGGKLPVLPAPATGEQEEEDGG